MKQIILLLTLLGCASAQGAGLYKWVDENGVIHYSATPPSKAKDYQALRKPPKPSTDPDAAMQALRDRVANADKLREEDERKQAGTQATAEQQEQVEKNCQLAQANLKVLEASGEVAQTGPDGKKSLLTAEQRRQQLEQTRKDIEYYCN